MNFKYAIITPVKDEEEYFTKTAESILRQEIRPTKWIIINDGSQDRTDEIVEQLVATNDWIIGIHNAPRARRKPGGESVLQAGLRLLRVDEYDFISRMDGDLAFEPFYFSRLFTEFIKNPRLGIASGVCFVPCGGRLMEERHPRFHTRGPLKTYRTSCFKAIDGLDTELGWDTIDEIKANMLGWQTRSFPELQIVHFRKTQTASGILPGLQNLGRASYRLGYHPIFMLLRAMKQTLAKPYVVGGASMLWGYCQGYLKKMPRVDDPALIRYVREQQLRKILHQETIWK